MNYFEEAKRIARIKDPNPTVEHLTKALWKIRDLSIMVDSRDPEVVMKAAAEFIDEIRTIADEALIMAGQ